MTKCIFKFFFFGHTDCIQFRMAVMLVQTKKKKEINREQLSGKYPSDYFRKKKKVAVLTDTFNAVDVPQYMISNVYT